MKKRCFSAILLAVLTLLLSVVPMREAQKRESDRVWTITSYPTLSGAQGMCYTIEDNEGHFVLVDGGWDDCSWQVLNLIASHGAHVDAWILTHPHQDHISAFLNLYEHGYDFTVDTIYAIDLDAEFYSSVVAMFDGGYEFFERFQKIAENLDNVQYVHTGETYDLIGLQMDILNAYEKGNPLYDNDPANTGSIMFRLTGPSGGTMLFCADNRREESDYLIETYGESLKADYLQVAHHGTGATLSMAFDELVDPKVAFFDLVEWQVLDPEGYSRPFYDFFIDRGTTVYTFGNPPDMEAHSVTLR